jgi:hypothetical protein
MNEYEAHELQGVLSARFPDGSVAAFPRSWPSWLGATAVLSPSLLRRTPGTGPAYGSPGTYCRR